MGELLCWQEVVLIILRGAKTVSIKKGVGFSFLCVLFASQTALSALPLLSKAELEYRSAHILIGDVYQVKCKEEKSSWGTKGDTDVVCTAYMNVVDREKGDFSAGDYVMFKFWHALHRAPGWTGDTGQSERVQEKTYIRAYLTSDFQGNLSLLKPNGWELLPKQNEL